MTGRDRQAEPQYRGTRLSIWLQAFDSIPSGIPEEIAFNPNRQSKDVAQAEEAVRQIGSNAVPYLLTMLYARDVPFRAKLIQMATHLHLWKRGNSIDAGKVRGRAIVGFKALGATGKTAIPALTRMLAKSNVDGQRAASTVLANLGSDGGEAVPDLLRIVRHSASARRRNYALVALWRIDRKAALATGYEEPVTLPFEP